MNLTKATVFEQITHELQSAALNRMDNGHMYVFMKEGKSSKDNYNLLIFDGAELRKSNYSFSEKNDAYFLNLDGVEYEMLIPAAISDEEAFTLTIKDPDGVLIRFENYI